VELKSDDEVILFPKLDEVRFVIDIEEKEDPKDYWEAVKSPNKHL
jgi:hypothetical protein